MQLNTPEPQLPHHNSNWDEEEQDELITHKTEPHQDAENVFNFLSEQLQRAHFDSNRDEIHVAQSQVPSKEADSKAVEAGNDENS